MLTNGSITLTAINGSDASGNFSLGTGTFTNYTFANTPFVYNGSSDLSSLSVGQVLTGSVTLSTGTVTLTTTGTSTGTTTTP